MSRYLSLRSFETTARSAVTCILSVVLLCMLASQSFSQTYDKSMEDGMGYPGAQGNQQGSSLSNIGSGITRPASFSSVGAVRALLYGDAVSVVHVNYGKIDYEGLTAFFDEVVDKGAGSVRSDDKYRVDLREYQKTRLKSSFKSFLGVVQNAIVKKLFQNHIDEVYFISYGSDKDDVLGATIAAIPTAGLSEAEVKAAIDSISDSFQPYSIFVRYGFIVAVVKHDAAKPLDTSEIDARFQAKILQSQNKSYGSYSASGAGASNGYNAGSGSGMSSPGSSSMGATGRNSQDGLLRDYQTEIQEATEKNRAESRRSTLPRIRNRFAKPASEEESAPFMQGLQLGDGVALSVVVKDMGELSSLLELTNDSDQNVASPFAGLGVSKPTKTQSDSEGTFSSIREAFDEQDADGNVKSMTIALSLVGTPRLIAFLGFENENEAQNGAKSIEAALKLVKPIVVAAIQEQITKSSAGGQAVDLSPMLNAVFDELKPRVSNADLALVLNFEPIKSNAPLFMPLLGGVETKSAKEMESETIDWNLGKGEENSASSDDVDESDLFDDESDSENVDDAPADQEEEETGEEDPFA